ncbi:Chanoclavine-I aldehyde reductase fgaOx3 [Penicillium frequentans]|uniref:chanoclavine-I aldehyde reductase n=1 Tax=Penicillium frequentans TaxID=3151616 RepID=A0AAD6CXU9_9EURO|nr:Chanoclavine-I aldehyde reductase fgaOx3 [Penicillium glabrum]KAJ5557557.1 Chanoclavine-I aldehyde reductase fgaOx3 [Penicillium glabrum]KAJ5557768.1 Chanoclavine-I aldehyde reductase fgaOx3 [Penicillium glabrum]
MTTSKLFDTINLGRMRLSHRMAMAPMTRFRADDAHVPLPMVKEYYEQRAAVPGTLIITEATFISPQAGGFTNVPGIYNQAQIDAWRQVTDAVHARGSHIYLQLWALGRAADAEVLNAQCYGLVSSSASPLSGDSPTPRELTEAEIRQYISDYAEAAKNAIAAGFDGVEIHGTNGFLVDQFIQDTCNKRKDAWGGSIENRARFALEVTSAIVGAIGADRTAIRLGPWSPFLGMRMADPIPQFTYLVKKLAEFKLAYLHLVESRISGDADVQSVEDLGFLFHAYGDASPIIIAGGYKADSAKQAVDLQYKNHEVIIAFGRPFTSNPDLPFRIMASMDLRPHDRDVFYLHQERRGYIDYDFSEEFKATLEPSTHS